jgi:hypothetical protein
MGNLYTHLLRIPTLQSQRIGILSRLKKEYKSSPRNYKEIDRLKKALLLFNEHIQKRNLKENSKKKTFVSIFNGAYRI